MSTQITVRIPDQLAAFIDGLVTSGDVSSRADAVTQALVHEQRRQRPESTAPNPHDAPARYRVTRVRGRIAAGNGTEREHRRDSDQRTRATPRRGGS